MKEFLGDIWHMPLNEFLWLLVVLFIGLSIISTLVFWGLYKWQKKQEDEFLEKRKKRRKEFFNRR